MSEKILETRTCTHCASAFDITDVDQTFLEKLSPTIAGVKISLPFPTHCPKCRKMRRYAWRNEKNIYKRKCDATGKEIISLFSPDAPCPVYESAYWYSDAWDARKYARDFDFSRPFFEQWWELKKVVPMPGKAVSYTMENSDYSDNCGALKNCYLCFNGAHSEDCLYDTNIWDSKDCIDCISTVNCESCYELAVGIACYKVQFSYDVKNSRECRFVYHANGCKNCYGCFDLENQEYCIWNEQYTQEAYHEKLKEIIKLPLEEQRKMVTTFLTKAGYTKMLLENIWCENVVGSTNCENSKNVSFSTYTRNSEDIRYCFYMVDSKRAMDADIWGDRVDKAYECTQIGENGHEIYFSVGVWSNIAHVFYMIYCVGNVRDCFGCVGLRDASYCILNKQYTKEEYEVLVPKIIEHMVKTGEWGEFFPAKYSHFGYNQTMNMTKYPLTKSEALRQGFTWSDFEAPFPKVAKTIPWAHLPDEISKIPDDILNWAIECEVTGRPFRIMAKELEFYRKHSLPVPRKHPEERYQERTKWYLNY
jgi:hypothetical protein